MSGRGKFDRDYYSDIYTWNKDRLAERMGQIEMSFKIMPIVDNLRNRDQFPMEHRGIVNEEDKRLVQWSDFFNYKQSYFWYNNTVKNFPTFAYDEETPEVQTSEQFCLHIWWNPPKREKAYGMFEDVYGQPQCHNSGSQTKFIWKPEDPKTGLSFPLFKRVILNPACGESVSCNLACKEAGGRVAKDGSCYAYDIISRLCVKVDLLVSEDGKFDALSLDEGCYDGDVGFYTRALPDKLYKFDFVPVEVRSKYDPYTVWAQHGY